VSPDENGYRTMLVPCLHGKWNHLTVRHMGLWFRGFIVCLAIAFATGGFIRAATAGQPCLSHSPLPAIQSDHAAHAGHAAHHGSDKGHTKDGNTKCCGMCIVGSTGIVPAQMEVTESRITRIDYVSPPATATGRSVPLDPGIPKRLT
jgi:hypothetical protein